MAMVKALLSPLTILARFWRRSDDAILAAAPANAAVFDDTNLEGYDDPGPAIRFGYRVIFLGIGVFCVWAVFAPIGEGVPAQGVVVVESQRKVIAHLTGGTVATVNVRENLSVKEGDVLFTLETGRLQTALDTVQHEYVNSAARLARLSSEQVFADKIDYPDELKEQILKLKRQDILLAQDQLFRARQQALAGEQNVLREGLNASQIQSVGAREQLANREKQAEILRQEIQSNRSMVEEGYAPRNRLMEQERQLVELATTTSDIRTRLAREGSSTSEIRYRILQRRQEYLKEVETQSAETRRELATLGERLKDARNDLERSVVRAPVTGQVVSLLPLSPGAVITAGAKLMEVVPDGDKLLFDVQIPVHVINRVQAGLETDIRITAFLDAPSLIIGGRIQSISSDRREPPNGQQQPYYLARVEVTPAGMSKLGEHRLRPGMTAEVVIKTGERSFMAYLLAPIQRQLFQAFKEP